MRKFRQALAVVLAVLMIASIAMVSASANDSEQIEHTYVVAGVPALCTSEWDGEDTTNAMTLAESGLYEKTFESVAVGSYQFKVVEDGERWIGDGEGNANFDITVSEVCNVTITFDPTNNEVGFYGDSVEATTGITIDTMQLMGFTTWQFADAPVMTAEDDVYTVTCTNVAAGSYSYKFAANGNWDANWGAGEDATALSGAAVWNAAGNFALVLTEAKDVTFTLDLSEFDFASKTGATYSVELSDATVDPSTSEGEPVTSDTEPVAEIVPGYYLTGSEEVCGTEWGYAEASTNGSPKLTASNDGSFYYYVATNVPSSANNVDDKGMPRYEFKVVYIDANGKATWHPGGMGNNTYVEVPNDGSTVVFKFVQLSAAPEIEGANPEAVVATVYGPEDEVPVVDDTVAPVPTPAKISVAKCTVTGLKTVTYKGKAIKLSVKVKNGSTVLKEKTDYTVSYKNNTNAGKATVTITGKGSYTGTLKKTFTIAKAANTMKVSAKALKVKVNAKKTTFKASKAFSVTKAKGAVSYKQATKNKYIAVSKKGVVTVKKGLKKNKTYKINVKVSAKGDKNYKAGSKSVTLKVKVVK